jgi:hypothetical protein
LETPPIFNNVSEVVPITAVLPNIAVLGDTSLRVISSQAPVRAERRCDFTSGFKFRISPVLGVRASEASDLLMVGYPLELWQG